MKTLYCKEITKENDEYVARGETAEDVMRIMERHLEENHKDFLDLISESKIRDRMRMKIREGAF